MTERAPESVAIAEGGAASETDQTGLLDTLVNSLVCLLVVAAIQAGAVAAVRPPMAAGERQEEARIHYATVLVLRSDGLYVKEKRVEDPRTLACAAPISLDYQAGLPAEYLMKVFKALEARYGEVYIGTGR